MDLPVITYRTGCNLKLIHLLYVTRLGGFDLA